MFVQISRLMTLFEFIALIKRNLLWVLLTSLTIGIAAYFYISPREDRVALLIKCYPNEKYNKEIAHIAPAIHDLFKKSGKKKSSNYELIDDFIDQYQVKKVRQAKSSADTLNVWFKLIFDDNNTNFSEISNDFIDLVNQIIIEHSIIKDRISDDEQAMLRPLFPEKPYTDVSLSTITPWKGALLVFILGFIFAALLLSVIEDFKKHRSSSIH
jgi:hypothetical protein